MFDNYEDVLSVAPAVTPAQDEQTPWIRSGLGLWAHENFPTPENKPVQDSRVLKAAKQPWWFWQWQTILDIS